MRRLWDLDGEPLGAGDSPPDRTGASTPMTSPTRQIRLAIQRHPLVALLAASMIVALGAAYVTKRVRPLYRAESQLLLAPMPPRILYTDEEWHNAATVGYYEDYVRTIKHLATMPDVLDASIHTLAEQDIAWAHPGVSSDEYTHHLRARLAVEIFRDTHLIGVSMTDAKPELVAPVVNAVVENLLAQLETAATTERDETLGTLQANLGRLNGELEACQSRLDELTRRVGMPLLDERTNPFFERLHVLDEGMTKIFRRRVEAEGDLAKALGRKEELLANVPKDLVESALAADPTLRDSRTRLQQARVRLLRDQTGKGASNPDVHRSNEAEAKVAREHQELLTRTRQRAIAQLQDVRRREAEELVEGARRELAAAQRSESLMKEVLSDAREELVGYEQARVEGTRLRRRATDLVDSISKIERRVEQLLVEADAPIRVHRRSVAQAPRKPVKDLRKPFLVAIGFLGVLGGVFAAFLRSRIRPRIFDAEDAGRAGILHWDAAPDDARGARAADAYLQLTVEQPHDDTRLLIVPASPGDDGGAAESFARHLYHAAASGSPTMFGCLAGDEGSPLALAPTPRRVVGPAGESLEWGPLGTSRLISAALATSSTRQHLDALEARTFVRIVSAPSPLDSSAAATFVSRGYHVVVVAQRGRTLRHDLSAAVEAVSAAGGRSSVLIVGNQPARRSVA